MAKKGSLTMENNGFSISSFVSGCRKSLVSKLLVLGLIILLLMIPYFMSVSLRSERQSRARNAEQEVSSKWGGTQLVTAPVLRFSVQKTVVSGEKTNVIASQCILLPDSLKTESSVAPEVRYRGIYPILLYRSVIRWKAEFTLPAAFPNDWKQAGSDGRILIRVSDVKGIESLNVSIDGKPCGILSGPVVSVPVKALVPGKTLSCSGELKLNGCRTLLFSPIGKVFHLTMTSPWEHPSFTGDFLPGKRSIGKDGFHAEWTVGELNSSFPQLWIGNMDENLPDGGSASRLGVSLVQPAGVYQQVERVSDYAFLVIAIVLVAFLIGEMLTKIWIHPLQYFFAGLSLVMFYVLLLALAEHLPFNWSYLITTLVIAGITTMYCRMIFAKKQSAALLLGGVMLLAYLLIFMLTRLEDYALLAGSIVLLVLLGILMRVTGNMNREEHS